MAIIIDPSKPSPQSGAAADLVKEGDTSTFAADVIDASMKVPVIVDFWATWCGPCKQLGPLLEKLVRQAAGLVRLVKIDIDKNQALAAQLRIQSVPTVYAFVGGRPVDGFVGAQPESKLREFIHRLTGDAAEPSADSVKQGQDALNSGDAKTAAAIFSHILAEDPGNPTAIAGLIRSRVATGDLKGARSTINGLSDDLAQNPEIAAAFSAVELIEQMGKTPGVAALREQASANPADHQTRFDLAKALYASGRPEGAIDELLQLIRADRAWNDEAARKLLVKIFDALGHDNPLTSASRRRLSSVLFS